MGSPFVSSPVNLPTGPEQAMQIAQQQQLCTTRAANLSTSCDTVSIRASGAVVLGDPFQSTPVLATAGKEPGHGMHQQEGPAGPLAQALKNSSTRDTAGPKQQRIRKPQTAQAKPAVAGSTTERGRETTLKDE